MTTTAHNADTSPRAVDALLGELDRAWKRSGVSRGDRRAMAGEVAIDLYAAAADGVDPRSLLAPGVAAFAAQVAAARDVAQPVGAYARTLIGGLTGAATVLVASALAFPFVHAFLSQRLQIPSSYPLVGSVAFYGALGLACLSGALLGVRLALKGHSRSRATAWRAALLLPLAAAVMSPLAITFARVSGYSMETGVLLVEAVLTLGGFIGALMCARWWALR